MENMCGAIGKTTVRTGVTTIKGPIALCYWVWLLQAYHYRCGANGAQSDGSARSSLREATGENKCTMHQLFRCINRIDVFDLEKVS